MLFGKSIKNLSDEELMDKVKGGSERALEEIYQRYSQPLLRYFYRMLWQDKNKAEDFLHDLFVKLLQRPAGFDSSRKFSTWIYSIAHNFCKNEYRKQAFRSALHGNLNGNESMSETATNQLDQQSFQKALEEVLKEEDEEARTIFTLRYELEKSFTDISEIVNKPEGTVKSKLFYLKKRLAIQLDHYRIILENE
jgi:RNA polymerase sigma-70 factor (ECF subfamily)